MITRPNEHEILIPCDCSAEILQVRCDDSDFQISIYRLAGRQPSFKDRLRYCWKILTTGYPYGDQVILSKEKTKQLTDFIHGML